MSSTEVSNSIKVIKLEGNYLIEQEQVKVLQKIERFISEGFSKFILDLSSLNHINSAGLSVLIRVLTKSRTAGGDTVLINIPKNILQLLIITKLNSVFTSYEDISNAKDALSNT
jgi:anti-sigma B factor antagonist